MKIWSSVLAVMLGVSSSVYADETGFAKSITDHVHLDGCGASLKGVVAQLKNGQEFPTLLYPYATSVQVRHVGCKVVMSPHKRLEVEVGVGAGEAFRTTQITPLLQEAVIRLWVVSTPLHKLTLTVGQQMAPFGVYGITTKDFRDSPYPTVSLLSILTPFYAPTLLPTIQYSGPGGFKTGAAVSPTWSGAYPGMSDALFAPSLYLWAGIERPVGDAELKAQFTSLTRPHHSEERFRQILDAGFELSHRAGEIKAEFHTGWEDSGTSARHYAWAGTIGARASLFSLPYLQGIVAARVEVGFEDTPVGEIPFFFPTAVFFRRPLSFVQSDVSFKLLTPDRRIHGIISYHVEQAHTEVNWGAAHTLFCLLGAYIN